MVKKRVLVLWIIILSILIHIILFLLFSTFSFKKNLLHFFTQKNKPEKFVLIEPKVFFEKPKIKEPLIKPKKIDLNNIKVIKKEEPKKEPDNGLPASLKPRKSTFGLPDGSQDLSEKEALDKVKEKKINLDEHNKETESKKEDLNKDITPIKTIETNKELLEKQAQENKQKQNLKKTDKTSSSPEKNLGDTKVKDLNEAHHDLKSKVSREITPKPLATANSKKLDNLEVQNSKTKKETEKLIAEIARKQAIIENAKPDKVNVSETKNISQPKNKKSIIAMTKGFIENLKGEGSDWLERKGDDSKRPSFEELKYLSYEQKVTWHLQHSWKQNFEYNNTTRVPEGKVIISFTINKNGSLADVCLLQSSGNDKLDKIIIKSVELSNPLPPLPEHFGTNTYKTGRIINVHSYGFNL